MYFSRICTINNTHIRLWCVSVCPSVHVPVHSRIPVLANQCISRPAKFLPIRECLSACLRAWKRTYVCVCVCVPVTLSKTRQFTLQGDKTRFVYNKNKVLFIFRPRINVLDLVNDVSGLGKTTRYSMTSCTPYYGDVTLNYGHHGHNCT